MTILQEKKAKFIENLKLNDCLPHNGYRNSMTPAYDNRKKEAIINPLSHSNNNTSRFNPNRNFKKKMTTRQKKITPKIGKFKGYKDANYNSSKTNTRGNFFDVEVDKKMSNVQSIFDDSSLSALVFKTFSNNSIKEITSLLNLNFEFIHKLLCKNSRY